MEFDKLKDVIAGVLSVDPREITEETTLIEDLGADSLDLFQIAVGIEEAFQIELMEEQLGQIKTAGDALKVLQSIVEEKE